MDASAPRGRLTIVATPIGNLEDMSPRAVKALAEADVILAEDTRRTRALLTHLGIAGKRIERLDAHVERHAVDRWVSRLEVGDAIALVTDAGTPAVSDPGSALVRAAAGHGRTVVPIPGPSAVVTALAAAGFPADRFRFFGFLPRKGSGRSEMIDAIVATQETVVFFESPQRAEVTLAELAAQMPDRDAVVARELTKLHEELVRGTLAELAARTAWRGELTIVLGPYVAASRVQEDVDARIDALLAAGGRAKDVAKVLAEETKLSVRELYQRILERGQRDERDQGEPS
ncbi:MAG: 16S rRNA (cytidine(1402)-2'-O)-methyltransferase [Deltaproteobacteria bacterium]|nr:16S rRNA (cytidine(1402)-2'-O)-methyltransferase [Deltaproteobacteria bacterium]